MLSSDVHKQRGNAAYAAGEYATAVEAYTSALAARQDEAVRTAVLFSNRAAAHLKLGKWTLAASDASEALAIVPADFKALRRRAAARKELGDVAGAFEDLHAALDVGGRDAETMRELRSLLESDVSPKVSVGSNRDGPVLEVQIPSASAQSTAGLSSNTAATEDKVRPPARATTSSAPAVAARAAVAAAVPCIISRPPQAPRAYYVSL